ncbi:MAG: adenylyltransferase/cytidyltransferase family protein [Candidatus Woesearchaeota archaeon]|nr:MAG: adenylyltransferase/cytidyltransferase family protein [Candidatus Woesearchaeota archaeon]
MYKLKKVVWKNKSNGQLCVTIPRGLGIKEGHILELKKVDIKKIAYLGIVGDLFHYGHLQTILFAKSIVDYVVCGILTDEAVKEYRGEPISNLKERKAVISNLRHIDKVMIQHSRDPEDNLKKIHEEFPEAEIILIHGSDWKYVPGSEYIRKINGKLRKTPYYDKLSTFKITNKLIENIKQQKDLVKFSSLLTKEKNIPSEKENKTIISNKADTLEALQPLLKKSKIEKLFSFSVSEWKNNREKMLQLIREKFDGKNIVVRSSALTEDTEEESMAGYFESFLSVDSKNTTSVESAINKVIKSYEKNNSGSSFNKVLIQAQTDDIEISGVLFTHSLEKSAPYYVINFDDSTGESNTVTKGVENKSISISKFCQLEKIPNKFKKLIESVKEIEEIVPNLGLDIEFSINKYKEVIIFQVRPLTCKSMKKSEQELIKNKIEFLKREFEEIIKKKEHLGGEKTILADMPDWNPAEIIGDRPNHLAYTLYDYLITNSAWHEARTSQGYHNVNPAKLVVLMGNKPYIDVRNSFNSFVPSTINPKLRHKLVSFYLKKLEENPELQDKIEFEIAHTCYDINFDERTKDLINNGFDEEEIKQLKGALLELTNNLILNSKKTINEDLNSLKKLIENKDKLKEDLDSVYASVHKLIYNAKYLLDDCRERGTVQFSRLARLAFVGKIILKSLVKKGVMTKQEYYRFMDSINTVATEMNKDFEMLSMNRLDESTFIKKYNHLRPGSYDITNPRYGLNPLLIKASKITKTKKLSKFELNEEKKKKITRTLKEYGLKFDAEELFEFAKSGIESREYSKFEFTKNLSDAIEFIALAGELMGFTREEMSMLSVHELFSSLKMKREDMAENLKSIISSRIKGKEINSKIILPPIIFSKDNFDIIQSYNPKPNFITQHKIKGSIVKIGGESTDIPEIENKIVILENGDPGYDWIFTKKPAGLITKYGGVASHMAIRCAEFGIPAAIGCGSLYEKLNHNDSIILDCEAKNITKIK